MLLLAVETMVDGGAIQEAETALALHRPGLVEFGANDLGFRLGELVAEAKIAATEVVPTETERRSAETDWPWIAELDDPIRKWLIGAHRSANNLDVLRIAFVMYAGKIAEKLIVDQILTPFRSLSDPSGLTDVSYRDFSSFMQGGRAPSIGGFVLFLRAANRPYRSSDSKLLSEFRNFLRQLAWPEAKRLADREFVQALDRLAGTRNASAHIEEPTLEDIVTATSIVIKDDRPGKLFAALGVRNRS